MLHTVDAPISLISTFETICLYFHPHGDRKYLLSVCASSVLQMGPKQGPSHHLTCSYLFVKLIDFRYVTFEFNLRSKYTAKKKLLNFDYSEKSLFILCGAEPMWPKSHWSSSLPSSWFRSLHRRQSSVSRISLQYRSRNISAVMQRWSCDIKVLLRERDTVFQRIYC